MKKAIVLISRILALTVLGVIVTAAASAVTPQPEIVKSATGASAGQTMLLLFIDRLMVALIFAFLLEKTILRGMRLVGLLFWVVFGITTFMMQIETLVFGSAFPGLSTSDVFRLVLTALVSTLIFVPLAVLVMGRWKDNGEPVRPLFKKDYLTGLILLAVIYPILYFSFGYFVAWQSAAVREFYATTTITTAQPLLTLIQVARGALWVLAGLPLLVMFDRRIHTIIASILCYSLLPSFSLILPNPLMPEPVRLAHLVEISLSMAIFGGLFGWIMASKAPFPRGISRNS
ncbi:MAG: hypothetical protein GYA15_03295 [Leptolinea sp.]|jgi:hypothetical protein|nr:hypothetical protein [Leptolinea sp.]